MSELLEWLVFSKESWERLTGEFATVFICSQQIKDEIERVFGMPSIVDMDECVDMILGCRIEIDNSMNYYGGYSWR